MLKPFLSRKLSLQFAKLFHLQGRAQGPNYLIEIRSLLSIGYVVQDAVSKMATGTGVNSSQDINLLLSLTKHSFVPDNGLINSILIIPYLACIVLKKKTEYKKIVHIHPATENEEMARHARLSLFISMGFRNTAEHTHSWHTFLKQ